MQVLVLALLDLWSQQVRLPVVAVRLRLWVQVRLVRHLLWEPGVLAVVLFLRPVRLGDLLHDWRRLWPLVVLMDLPHPS